jgi:hypothetical protein
MSRLEAYRKSFAVHKRIFRPHSCRDMTRPIMERKMLAFVSMVSMVAALGALAWALGRSSESLIATHPAVMAAAAHR